MQRRWGVLVSACLLMAACGGGDRPTLDAATDTAPTSPALAASPDDQVETEIVAEGTGAGSTADAAASAEALAEPTDAPAATPTPAPTAVPTPAPPSCVELLPDRVALAQMLMPLAVPAELAQARTLAADREIGWVGLLGNPSASDLALLAEAATNAPIPVLVASDEEGGRVQRLAPLLGALPSAQALAALPLDEITALIAQYGESMRGLGIDIAFAPVIDVGGGPGIGDRAFSSDPDSVVRNAGAVIDGLRQAGVTPVLKHFPGHGRASGDTHLGFALTPSIDELRAADLVPYEALLADDTMVMVGHLLVPGLTDDIPTSLSPAAIDGLLRNELGFDGLVITDALGMGAISAQWNNAQAAELAFIAGADIAIIDTPAQVAPVLDALVQALAGDAFDRSMVDDSVARIFAHKGLDACEVLDAIAGTKSNADE